MLNHLVIIEQIQKYRKCPALNLVFKKQMVQAANTDLFNPLVPKAHNRVCPNLLFPLQIKPVKSS